MSRLGRALIACALIFVAVGKPLTTEMFPISAYAVNEIPENIDVYQGQLFKRNFDGLGFQFSSDVYERDSYLGSDVIEDFESNKARQTDRYKSSQYCYMLPTQITLDKVAETPDFPNGVTAYLYDTQYGAYLLAGRTIYLYWIGYDGAHKYMLQKRAQSALDAKMNEDTSFMFTAIFKNFIIDQNNLHIIQIQADINGIHTQPLAGYIPLGNDEHLVDAVVCKNILHVLGSQSINSYTLTQTAATQKDFFGKFYNTIGTEFVDIACDESTNTIYVLDRTNGIYIFDANNPSTYNRFDIGYGDSIKMEIYGDTIEVICEYRKTRFVAELVRKGEELYLNRFYDQISGFRDIDFYEDMGVFIGEDQIMIVSHSANRNALKGLKRQHMSTFSAFGLINFQVIQPKQFSDQDGIALFGITQNSLVAVKASRKMPQLVCNYDDVGTGSRTLVTQINITHCGNTGYTNYKTHLQHDEYCRIRRAWSVNIKRPYERRASNLYSTALFLIVVIGILLVIGAAAKWKVNMNSLMNRLRRELQKKKARGSTAHVLPV